MARMRQQAPVKRPMNLQNIHDFNQLKYRGVFPSDQSGGLSVESEASPTSRVSVQTVRVGRRCGTGTQIPPPMIRAWRYSSRPC